MSVNKKVVSIAYAAGGDMSSNQFRIVKMASDGQIDLVTDQTTPILGVLLNKPSAAGMGAEVAIEGADVKIEAGAALDEGDLVVAVAGGRGSAGPAGGTAVGTAWILGICTQAASGSGAFAGVLVRPSFYVRANAS